MFSGKKGLQDEVTVIEPPKPIRKSVYLCDRRFHTELVLPLFDQDLETYGVVLITGEGSKFYTLSGSEVKLLNSREVRLPKNQKKGGQSAPRIGRIRDGDILRYVNQVAETCIECYMKDNLVHEIDGLVLAGYADKMDRVAEVLHPNLKKIMKKLVISDRDDIYAIQEQCLQLFNNRGTDKLDEFYDHLTRDTGLASYGKFQVESDLVNAMLKKLFLVEDMVNDKVINICEQVGCELVKVRKIDDQDKQFVRGYGGLGGIKWY